MIYLIDDNIGNKRIAEMNIHFCDDGSFATVLISIERLKKDCNLNFLHKADCILVHKTTLDCDEKNNFIEKSNFNATQIIESISNYGTNIPLVIFSNRMGEIAQYDYDKNPRCIYQIKKNIFYPRLYDFLSNYEREKLVDLRILAYGSNFVGVELGRYAGKIIQDIGLRDSAQPVSPSYFSLNDLRNFHQLAGIPIAFDELINKLEDDPMPIKAFKKRLNQIVDSFTAYGKNIHPW